MQRSMKIGACRDGLKTRRTPYCSRKGPIRRGNAECFLIYKVVTDQVPPSDAGNQTLPHMLSDPEKCVVLELKEADIALEGHDENGGRRS